MEKGRVIRRNIKKSRSDGIFLRFCQKISNFAVAFV